VIEENPGREVHVFTFVVDQDKASKQDKMQNVSIYSLIDDAAAQSLAGA